MLPILLSFRFVMLLATLGSTAGALLMFWEGALKLEAAFQRVLSGSNGEKLIIASVMGSVDNFLFGIVLVIFAYAITFGFVIDLSYAGRKPLPAWMRINSVSELKHTFFEIIVLYLAVDFATDIALAETHVTWETLVMPASILLLAGAMRLMTHGHAAANGLSPVDHQAECRPAQLPVEQSVPGDPIADALAAVHQGRDAA